MAVLRSGIGLHISYLHTERLHLLHRGTRQEPSYKDFIIKEKGFLSSRLKNCMWAFLFHNQLPSLLKKHVFGSDTQLEMNSDHFNREVRKYSPNNKIKRKNKNFGNSTSDNNYIVKIRECTFRAGAFLKGRYDSTEVSFSFIFAPKVSSSLLKIMPISGCEDSHKNTSV